MSINRHAIPPFSKGGPGGISIGALLLAFALTTPTSAEDLPYAVHSTRGKFEDVRFEVEQAIINRGLVVATTSPVAEMLERTGRDVGSDRRLYLHGETIQFCSAVLSRKAMEADPRNIVYCPYGIAVYVLPEAPDTVYLSYRKADAAGSPASRAALREVERLLEGIVREAIGR